MSDEVPDEPESEDNDADDAEIVYKGVTITPEMRRNLERSLRTLAQPATQQALESIQRAGQLLSDQLRTAAESWQPALEQTLIRLRQNLLSTPPFDTARWSEQVAQLASKAFEAIRQFWPQNWLGGGIDFRDAITVAETEGLPLVWVPRHEVVKLLLDAPDAAARRGLLEQCADDIVEDCGALLDTIDHERLREHRDRLREAVEAHRAGLHGAGQAMSAVVVTALLQWVYGHGQLRNVKSSELRWKEDEDAQLLLQLKVGILIEAATVAVRSGTDELDDDDLPGEFNRHLTLHRVAKTVYTMSGAMCALLLASALLAEAQWLMERGRLKGAAD